jgi:hypothetical protein
MAEFKIYGATPDVQLVLGRMSNTEHPNYAALDYIGDPIAFASPAHYGWYRFRLIGDVRKRCTFTPSDAFVVEQHQVYIWDDIDGVLATKVGFPTDLFPKLHRLVRRFLRKDRAQGIQIPPFKERLISY